MKKLVLVTLLTGASLLTSHAAIIATDDFNSLSGGLNGRSGGTGGWTGNWTAASNYTSSSVVQTYSGLNTSGANAVTVTGGFQSANRTFAAQTGRVWGSFTVNFSAIPGTLEIKLNEAGNPNWSAMFGFSGGNIFTNHSGGSALVNTAFTATASTTYFVAFTYDSTGATPTTFYVNPTGLGAGSAPSGSVSSASFTGTNSGMGPGIGSLSLYGDSTTLVIDDVRLGTTWADVSPSAIPEPSTYAALAGLGVLGLAAFRRRRA